MGDEPRTRRGLFSTVAARADAAPLARLLVAQQLSLACDERVLAARAFAGARPAVRSLVRTVRTADAAHVAATRQALRRRGGTAAASPDEATIDAELARHLVPGRPGGLRDGADALTLLVDVERVAIGAAYVALSRIGEGALAGLVASMMGSDAQHEALLEEARHPGAVAAAIPYGVVEGTA